jgi:hypothetical protein
MSLKNRLETIFRGWFPKEPKMPKAKLKMAETRAAKSKPWWWKPMWIITLLLTIVVGVVGYFLLDPNILEPVGLMSVALFFVGFSYYISNRPSTNVNRAMYIMVGMAVIGCILWLIWVISGLGRWITQTVGSDPSLLISFVVCYAIGALIGYLIGKKRNYVLPVFP